jgi:hypothetical protein
MEVGDQPHSLTTLPSYDVSTVPLGSRWKKGNKAGLDAVQRRKFHYLGLEWLWIETRFLGCPAISQVHEVYLFLSKSLDIPLSVALWRQAKYVWGQEQRHHCRGFMITLRHTKIGKTPLDM